MSEGNFSYLCEGFYPLEATDLTHAASLFALWKARRTYGPQGWCSRLDVKTELVDGATFEAFIQAPSGSETCLLTVLVESNKPGQLSTANLGAAHSRLLAHVAERHGWAKRLSAWRTNA
jgi:hypothetical protein